MQIIDQSQFSHFLLRCLQSCITKFLISFPNNVLYDHQYGFGKGRSTQHAIYTLADKITKSQEMEDIVIAILIDLKEAFDTVDEILLQKLYPFGIRGSMLKWVKGYSSHRTQYVVFDSEKSANDSIKCGVLQGSILGPLFFIRSVNIYVTFPLYFSRYYSLMTLMYC